MLQLSPQPRPTVAAAATHCAKSVMRYEPAGHSLLLNAPNTSEPARACESHKRERTNERTNEQNPANKQTNKQARKRVRERVRALPLTNGMLHVHRRTCVRARARVYA